MSHHLPQQPDCAAAWLAAAQFVDGQVRHEAHNVLIDIEDPTAGASLSDPVVSRVEEFLSASGKSVICVANTIFPEALYRRHGAPAFINEFHEKILPKVRQKRKKEWSGYYFERMTAWPSIKGKPVNQLWSLVERIRNEGNKSLNNFELALFDPARDIDNSPYGGQCLSFLSFKLLRAEKGDPKRLTLTAIYRNHYYIEKLLGNLIGLGRLMDFVAGEGGVGVGPLTVLSTHATIDEPGGAKRNDVTALLKRCAESQAKLIAAA